MNEETLGWFHCGRCGHLFQSPLGESGRSCPDCGRDPSTFGDAPIKSGPTGYATLPERRAAASGEDSLPQKRAVRKRRANSTVAKVLVAWLVFIILLAIVGNRLWEEDDRLGSQVRSAPITVSSVGDDERTILDEAIPQCARCLGSFLSSGTPEERNQYVRKPISLAGKMSRFYNMNPLVLINPTDVKLVAKHVINLESGPAIATTWEVVDGRKLDAVFYKEDGEWRLDWEQFVRYGDMPWPLFLAGSGGESGEFRLMARLRLADEKSATSQLSVVLYGPRFGHPIDPGNASPEFLISRDSEDGRLLAAAFRAEKAGKSPFDAALETGDPEGMIRVRVQVKRIDDQKSRSFVLEKVIACHWLSIDEPGLAPLSLEQVREDEAAVRDAGQPSKPEE